MIDRFLNREYRAIAFAVAIVVALLSGSLVAFTLPRGPVTATQALILMFVGLAVGLIAGVMLRSRWAMVLAPLLHGVAFEIGRIGAFGPTVSAIRVDSAYAILALIVGRGFYGMVTLAPMILGAYVGRQLLRRDRADCNVDAGAGGCGHQRAHQLFAPSFS